jgi:probable HAF family extracellular repeat protein
MDDIGSLGSGWSFVYGMNGRGDVVGSSMTEAFDTRAFLYRDGAMANLGTLEGGTVSRAWAVNDSGHVIGDADNADGHTRAFLYRDGQMLDLGTLGGSESTATAINNAGQVLGDSLVTADATYHTFLFSNGDMLDLGALPGWTTTTGNGLNNLGHVVGEATIENGSSVAFLWRDGSMLDLNSLLPPDSGWVLITALFINDADQVVGYGLHNDEFAWYRFSLGSQNHPPVARAGDDMTVECGSAAHLDGSASSDPDHDTLRFDWREGNVLLGSDAVLNVNFSLGEHTVTLTVTDEHGASAEDSLVVVVRDTTPPGVACPSAQTVAVGPNCLAPVPNFAASAVALDGCTSPSALTRTQSPAAGTMVGLGTHVVTVSVTDGSGNTGSCSVLLTVADMTPPTGDCPPALTVGAGDGCMAPVPDFTAMLQAEDNCTPAAQLVKRQTPAAGAMVGLGVHNVTLIVSDAAGNQSMCVTTLTVVDRTPPAVAVSPVTAVADENGKAALPNLAAEVTATDNCSVELSRSQTPAPGTLFGLGTYPVTLMVTDAAGNTTLVTTTFTVVDRTAPVITSISVSPNVITDANRNMVPVTVSVTAHDNCDPSPVARIVSITSDEPVTGPTDNTSPDWQLSGGLNAQVRAEYSKKGDGRVYTLTVACTDASGNSSTATVTVWVPEKQNGNGGPKAATLLTTKKKKK